MLSMEIPATSNVFKFRVPSLAGMLLKISAGMKILKDEFLLTLEPLFLIYIFSRSLGGDLLSLNSPKELDVSDLFRLFPSALGEKK